MLTHEVRSMAYKECNLRCTGSEASKHAKTAEETARKAAASEVSRSLFGRVQADPSNGQQREYHELIAKAVRDLLSQNAAPQPQPLAPEASLDVSPPTSGGTIGRYINAQHHADGLFSEVLKARLPEPARKPNEPTTVALKLTSPSTETAPHDSRREAHLLATTAKHPNIVPLLEVLQQPGGRLVLAFPFFPHDLATILHQNSLTDSTRRTILRDLFAALAHLHKQDIIHRDIKPANILLASPSGPAYLSDFGIAWSPASSTAEPADDKILDVGTTCYRPPELLFGNAQYGVELDLWAAGCTAAQVVCLGGKTLFEAGDLGSELALIRSVFETLGTPGLEVWPVGVPLRLDCSVS